MIIENGVLKKVEYTDINSDGSFVIPEGVTSIGNGAFDRHMSLHSITLPKGLTSIESNAFAKCWFLSSITIPEGVTSIGENAFKDCKSLSSIKIPRGVTSIGEGVFSGCKFLHSIKIPEGVTSIGESAFRDCKFLHSITIPEGVTSIGESAFRNCEYLSSITIPKEVTRIGDGTFAGCSSLSSIMIPEGVMSIGEGAFKGCSSLSSITIPKEVTRIGDGTFAGCSSLSSVMIPDGVTSIGKDAFSDCSSLRSITIPEGVTSIGGNAFKETIFSKSINAMLKEFNITIEELRDTKYQQYINEKLKMAINSGLLDIYYEFEKFDWLMNETLITFFKNNPYIPQEKINEIKELMKTIKNSQLIHSKDYNSNLMEDFALKMYSTIGLEEIKKLLEIKNVFHEEILGKIVDNINIESDFNNAKELEEYMRKTESELKSYFNTTYEIKGELGLAIALINGFEKNELYNTKEKMEFFKQLNRILQDENERKRLGAIENALEQIKPGSSSKIDRLLKRINEKNILNNIEKIDSNLNSKINEIFEGTLPEQRKFVAQLWKDILVREYKENGVVELTKIEKILREKLNEGNVGPAILARKEQIIEGMSEFFKAEESEINKTTLDMLFNVSEQLGRGYFRKLLQAQSPRMQDEKLEEWIKFVNLPDFSKDKIIYEKISEVKPEKKQELYKKLEENRIEMKGIVTYTQIEAMFGSMKEPYSESFREYYKKHKDEILSNPDIYTKLSLIHNNFDRIIANPRNTKVIDWSVNDLLEVINSQPIEGQRPGDEELAEIAIVAKAKGFNISNFSRVQEIFDKQREREETSIPPIITKQEGKYRGRILRPDDPLAIFVGTLTDCCQEIDNVGEPCMLHSVMDKHGGVFVVEELDKNGKVNRIVAQSWVWRNKGRLCFDNIEQEEAHFEDVASKKQSQEVMEVYRNAARQALETDQAFFENLVASGKITDEQRKAYQLQEVTVGVGYNKQRALNDLINSGAIKLAQDKFPEEYRKYRDSNTSYIIASIDDIDRSGQKQITINNDIEEKISKQHKDMDKEIPHWYGRRDEILILSEKLEVGLVDQEPEEYYDEDFDYDDYYNDEDEDDYDDYDEDEDYYDEDDDYDNNTTFNKQANHTPRIIQPIDGKIEQIKSIERIAHPDETQKLQEIYDTQDLKECYPELRDKHMRVAVNREATFYIVFGEDEDEIQVVDIARGSDEKLTILEMQEVFSQLTLDAKQKGKDIIIDNARNQDSISFEKFSELSEEEMKEKIQELQNACEIEQRKAILQGRKKVEENDVEM